MPKSRLRLFIFVFLAISGLCAVFYSNSLLTPFIWDDEALIVKNPIIRSPLNLPKAFTVDLYSQAGYSSNFYRPLQTVSYIWDYYFWKLDPFGYHLTNIILQILVAFLVFLFIRAIISEVKIAFAAAILFALCPLHTEVVTYISGRAEMLMGLFLLSSLLLFIKGRRIFSWVAFILGLLAKELAAAFPLAILAYLFYYQKDEPENNKTPLKAALPFFIISFLYIFFRAIFFNFDAIRPAAAAQTPLVMRITVLPEIIFTYLKLLFIPVDLHMGWTLSLPVNLWELFLNWFLLGIILVVSVFILRDKKKRALAFMFSWALIFFLPQSGLLPINAFIAEHFIYLSSISFFVLVAYFLHRYLSKGFFIYSIIGLSIFYGVLTSSRNLEWLDPLAFYEDIIKYSPNNFLAHNNLGLQYEYRYLYHEAMLEYRKALEAKPDSIEARFNLANIYFRMSMFKEAKIEYTKLKKIQPIEKHGVLLNNIGCIYQVEGFLDEALKRYRLALSLDPKLNLAHFNIAKIYIIKGNQGLAIQEVLKSLPEINPASLEYSACREAIAEYIKPFKDTPQDIVFYYDLGVKLIDRNLGEAAIPVFKRVIELAPLYDNAHFNLGLAYEKKGLKKDAIFEFKSALKINPDHAQARESLAGIIHKNN